MKEIGTYCYVHIQYETNSDSDNNHKELRV